MIGDTVLFEAVVSLLTSDTFFPIKYDFLHLFWWYIPNEGLLQEMPTHFVGQY